MAQGLILGGNLGHVSKLAPVVVPIIVQLPTTPRKRQPTADLLFRVWGLHERMNHINLTTLALMVEKRLLLLRLYLKEIINILSHARWQNGVLYLQHLIVYNPEHSREDLEYGLHRTICDQGNRRI